MPENKTTELYKGTVRAEFFEEWRNPDTNRINKHVYLINGKRCPISVTGVTGLLDKPALIGWAVRMNNTFLIEQLNGGMVITEELIVEASKQHTRHKEAAATAGTAVHAWCEAYIKGLNPEMPEDPRVLNGVNAFLAWEEEWQPKFLWSEKIVYSKKHKYIGIMDCAFTFGKEKHKINHAGDFKTSSGIYNEMLYQVSGYQGADEEESERKYGSKWILRFAKDDKFDKDTGKLIEAAGTFEARECPADDHKKDYAAFLGLLATKKREMELGK